MLIEEGSRDLFLLQSGNGFKAFGHLDSKSFFSNAIEKETHLGTKVILSQSLQNRTSRSYNNLARGL